MRDARQRGGKGKKPITIDEEEELVGSGEEDTTKDEVEDGVEDDDEDEDDASDDSIHDWVIDSLLIYYLFAFWVWCTSHECYCYDATIYVVE